jgi:cation transport regulator
VAELQLKNQVQHAKGNLKLRQPCQVGQKSKLILYQHAQHIFKKAHANAVKQYQEPEKRRGGKSQSAEEVAHKAAWAAVKQKYKKQGGEWISKE